MLLRLFHTLSILIFPLSSREKHVLESTPEVWGRVLRVRRVPGAEWVTTLSSYDHALVRDVVLLAKFNGSTGAAEKMGVHLADYLLEKLSDDMVFSSRDTPLLVPVPLGPARLRERGYNQSARIAEHAIYLLPKELMKYAPNTLTRTETRPQTTLSKRERAKNVGGAFCVPHPEHIQGRTVILIDDVITTGATLKDARRALCQAGARDVSAIVFARAE
jgi:ComF family protein